MTAHSTLGPIFNTSVLNPKPQPKTLKIKHPKPKTKKPSNPQKRLLNLVGCPWNQVFLRMLKRAFSVQRECLQFFLAVISAFLCAFLKV